MRKPVELDPLARLADLVVERLKPQLALIQKAITDMSTETLAEIETLKSDLATEIAAIGPAINASVAAALTAAGVDDATAQTALTALDKAVTDETANLNAMVAPAPPAT